MSDKLEVGDEVRFFFVSSSPVLEVKQEPDGKFKYLVCHSETDSFETLWLFRECLTPTGNKIDVNDPYYKNIKDKGFWLRQYNQS